MRPLACLSILAAGLAHAEVHLTIIESGKTVGDAVYSASLTPAGGKQSSMVMHFTTGGRKGMSVSETETVDRMGRQVSAVSSVSQGSTIVQKAVVDFATAGGAKVTVSLDGKSTVLSVPAPKTASLRDLSEFWFVKSFPRVGTWVVYQHLTLTDLVWRQVKTTYLGRKPVRVNGKQVLANELIQTEEGQTETYWLDNTGMPLLMTGGNTRLERR